MATYRHDLCPCGETQTMSHIVECCPLTKLNGGLSRLHSADEDVVSWLTSWFMTRIREEEDCIRFLPFTVVGCNLSCRENRLIRYGFFLYFKTVTRPGSTTLLIKPSALPLSQTVGLAIHGRWFDSQPFHCHLTTLRNLITHTFV